VPHVQMHCQTHDYNHNTMRLGQTNVQQHTCTNAHMSTNAHSHAPTNA
jgi:hypothetical protein